MATNERTSDRVASIAARGLDDPTSLTLAEIRLVCASALTQAPDHNASPPGAHATYNGLLPPTPTRPPFGLAMPGAAPAPRNALAGPNRLLIEALAETEARGLPWPPRFATTRSTD
jgi:hypothetical protein